MIKKEFLYYRVTLCDHFSGFHISLLLSYHVPCRGAHILLDKLCNELFRECWALIRTIAQHIN